MKTNAISISRHLVEAGLARDVADAIAEEMVTHSSEHLATKADVAELKSKIDTSSEQTKTTNNMIIGLYVGLALLFVSMLLE